MLLLHCQFNISSQAIIDLMATIAWDTMSQMIFEVILAVLLFPCRFRFIV